MYGRETCLAIACYAVLQEALEDRQNTVILDVTNLLQM